MLDSMHDIPMDSIRSFCRKWSITKLSIFGSGSSGEMHSGSDVDVLVEFAPGARITLFDLSNARHELERIFRRRVDLVTRDGIESARNPLRKQEILRTAKVVYAA